jgi:hypothetical protein
MADEPYYTCAVFNLKLRLVELLFIGAREFYLEVARIVDDFEITKTNHELCLFIEWKHHKNSNECKILERHKLCLLESCSRDSESQLEPDLSVSK